jgi:type IV secretion system protein VirB9
MPTNKSPLAALSLAFAIASASHAYASDVEQITFNGKPSVVVCAVLHLCDIELQPGEVITDLQVGDRARWSITPAITSSGPDEIHHLVVRPFDVGLETSAVVATTRRTYHLQLRSDASRYMPRVTFTYPDELQRKLENQITASLDERQKGLIPGTNEYLGDLDFAYKLNGESALKPVRVFNDHLKTVIELSPTNAKAAPTLIVTEAGKAGTQPIGYKVDGNRLVASGVFDAATLIYGSGNHKGSVSIERSVKTGNGAAGAITPAVVRTPSHPDVGSSAVASVPQATKPFTVTPSVASKPAATPPAQAPVSTPAVAVKSTTPVPSSKPAAPAAVIPAAAPSVPATTAPPLASKPTVPTSSNWDAAVGSSLRKSVEAWSKQAGWSVDWQAEDLDYPIEAPLQFSGSYEQAISGIFNLYRSAKRSFSVDGRRAQKLLIITEKSGNNGQGAAQ